jgi:hypothetical protein
MPYLILKVNIFGSKSWRLKTFDTAVLHLIVPTEHTSITWGKYTDSKLFDNKW